MRRRRPGTRCRPGSRPVAQFASHSGPGSSTGTCTVSPGAGGRGAVVVRREGERGAGRGPVRGRQPAGDRWQGGVPPQLLGQRLQDGQGRTARPAAQGPEPPGAGRASRHCGPMQSLISRVTVRPSAGASGSSPRTVPSGSARCRVTVRKTPDWASVACSSRTKGLPDGHRGARVVHQVQPQPALPHGPQHRQPPLGAGAQPRDAVGGRGLVHLVPHRSVGTALQRAQGALQRQRVPQHRRGGREQGAVRFDRRGARCGGRGRQTQGGARLGYGRRFRGRSGRGGPPCPCCSGVTRGAGGAGAGGSVSAAGAAGASGVGRSGSSGCSICAASQRSSASSSGVGRTPEVALAEDVGQAGEGLRWAGAVGGHQKASGCGERPRYGISCSASSSSESVPRPEERAR